MKALHTGEIKGISVDAVVPLAMKIMTGKSGAPDPEFIASIKSFDKNNDGKFDINELPPARKDSSDKDDQEESASKQVEPVLPEQVKPASGEALLEANSTGSWNW